MGTTVHFYANDDIFSHRTDIGGVQYKIDSVDAFIETLRILKGKGTSISRFLVSSHGSPGAVYFNGEALDITRVSELGKFGFEDMFETDARIFLHGCNVADVAKECGPGSCVVTNGRDFLKAMARTLLFKNGGRVGASTSSGFALTEKVFHFWGDVVYAYIKKGATFASIPSYGYGNGSTSGALKLPVRIAVGNELSTPRGTWDVVSQGQKYVYRFDPRFGVKWDRGAFTKTEGSGRWEMRAEVMRIKWESGTVEDWELPLFTQEQPGSVVSKSGRYTLMAEWDSADF